MEFDEHEEQEEEEEEEEEDDEDEEEEEEIGIRLPVTTATSTYELSRATKMASGGGGGSSTSCRYRECLKNHAVNIGGHAVDGCGEFMPAGEEGTLDALKCAACNCHRNFHRKETGEEGGAIIMATTPTPTPTSFHHPQFFHRSSSSIPAGYLHMPPHLRAPPPLALPSTSGGGGGGGGQSREDQEDISNPSSGGGGGGGGGGSSSRKRFRTKFSQEQKDKMLAFAERLGWRIQKHDEAAVQQFCTEICVKRHVLKVWMHNNKHTLGKKP